jgi:hypothetical protein
MPSGHRNAGGHFTLEFLKTTVGVTMHTAVKTMFFALFLFLTPVFSYAAPEVYPVREVFGFDSPALPRKAAVFSKWIKDQGGDALSKEYDAIFRKEFGVLAAKDVTDVNKHEVLVASLHLVRASQYVVPKLGNFEVHMPITLSIVITNPSTGEVIYSFTKTSYATALLARPDADAQASKILLDQTVSNYRSLLKTLVQEVKAGYNPQKIEITVAKEWKGLYILDKGGKFGVARDDSLMDAVGNEISVKYVTEDYAIAQSLLGKVERGQKFFKYATASTSNQFAKPRVLTMNEGWKDDALTNISRLFESEVSKESAFTLLPVNEYFRKLLEAVARDTYAGKFETTNQRELPQYMIKFSVVPPRVYTMSQKGKFSINHYEQYILGELLDTQGRIIFSAVGTNKIEDKNVGGMVFGKEARLEVLQKNAVVDLAEQFAKSIKFSHFVMPVKNVSGNSLEIEDSSRELRPGQSVIVYRNIGKVDGISSDVTVPLWQASVVEAERGKVKLDLVLPMVEKGVNPSRGDEVIVDAMSTAATADQSETSVTYCSKISPKLGSIDLHDFNVISRGYGYRLPYTLYDNDEQFSRMAHDALREGGFKDTLKLGKIDTAGRCLQAVHKASLDKNKCVQGFCSYDLNLVAGFRLYAGPDVKGKIASSTVTKTEDCQEECQIPVIQSDLSKNALTVYKDTIGKLRFQ